MTHVFIDTMEKINKNERKEWIDIVKGFAIIAVVLGHINFNYPVCKLFPVPYIYSWHIRVFFLVAGFFLISSKLVHPLSFIRGKIRRLYIPLLCLYIPATLLHNTLIQCGWYNLSLEYGGQRLLVNNGVGDYIISVCKTVFFMGREPIVGALWFAYVLFLSLCLISTLTWLTSKLYRGNDDYKERFVIITMIILALLSSMATNLYDYTIPRVSLVLTSSLLVYMGKIIMNKWKVEFNNGFYFICCIIGLYSIAVLRKNIHMDGNEVEIVSLIVSSSMALYILSFIAKKCRGLFARFLSLIGKESFYIMGLHFVAFKICYYIAIFSGRDKEIAELTPSANSLWELLYYLIGGVLLPVLIMKIWREGKKRVLCFMKCL